MGRIRSFRELEVYRVAFDLAMQVFRLTRDFPPDERFELATQTRRSSRSVCANIGEAWRRRRYPAAFIARLTDAEAEATETRVHLELARACGYLGDDRFFALDAAYDALVGRIVRMIDTADAWAVGKPGPDSGRSS